MINENNVKKIDENHKIMLISKTELDAESETRVAVLVNQKITDFDVDSDDIVRTKGNIMNVTVSWIEQSLCAVFCQGLSGQPLFLPFKEIHPGYYLGHDNKTIANEQTVTSLTQLIADEKIEQSIEMIQAHSFSAKLAAMIKSKIAEVEPDASKAGSILQQLENSTRSKNLSHDEINQLITKNIKVGQNFGTSR